MKKIIGIVSIVAVVIVSVLCMGAGIANISSEFINGDLVFMDANTKVNIATMNATYDRMEIGTANISAGLVNNVVIGGTTPLAGTFTTSTATTANVSRLVSITPLAATPSVTTGAMWVRQEDGHVFCYDGTTNNDLSD